MAIDREAMSGAERKESEQLLRASEARFRAAMDAVQSILWTNNAAGEMEGQQPGWSALTGQSFEEYMGYGWAKAVHPDDAQPTLYAWTRSVDTKSVFEFEHRVRRHDGIWRRFSIRAVPIISDGSITEWVGVHTDVTEQRAAAAALLDSDARFRFFDALALATQTESDPEAVMAATTRLLGEHLGVDICAYADVEADSDAFTIRRDWTAPGAASIIGSYRLDDFGQVAAAAQRSGVPLVTRNAIAELGEEQAATFTAIGVAATICLPLVKDGRLAAMMAVHSASPRDWSDQDVALVGEAAERCWAHVERVGAQAVLRESEARFRALAQAMPNHVWTALPDGALDWFNERVYQYSGAAVGSLDGAAWASLVHPDDLAIATASWGGALASGEAYETAFRLRGRDGVYRWHLARAVPILDPSGAILRWIGTNTDIDDQKAAVEALRESEARFREQFENANDYIFTADLEMRITSANPAVAVALGHTAESLIGHAVAEFVPPHERERNSAMLEAKLSGKQSTTRYDVEVEGPGGVAMVWEINSRLTRAADGSANGLHAIARDITAKRRAEAELRESEERLRALNADLERQVIERTQARGRTWQVTPDLMGALNAQGYFETSNPAWQTILGWSEAEVAGMSIFELLHPDDVERTRGGFDLTEQGRPAIRFPNRYRCKDGSYRWLSWVGVPEDGMVYCTGRDITDEKTREEELVQAQEALRQSQKLEAMGQLTGGVAHDFNNLLTPIIGSLDMLHRKGLGGAREQRLIDGALQSADRAKTLVQRLLAFARRQPLQSSAVDVAALVAGMADLVASTSGPQISLRIDVPDDLPPALADQNQLEMAILNLSVNARDAMPDGGTLTISAARETAADGHPARLAPGHYLRLSVADTGAGMDEDVMARAIEPFFSTKGVGKGTGLGLSMVHGLASQLGGALAIASRPGLGTRVDLWLPECAADAGVAAPNGVVAADGAAPDKRRGKVLLVDDEELVRMSTADMLAELGYDVIEAASGEEALARFDEEPAIDLLVTDYLMPGMTGADLARAARARRPGTRVLIVSGYAEAEGIAPDLPRLTKPFRQADLVASVASLETRA